MLFLRQHIISRTGNKKSMGLSKMPGTHGYALILTLWILATLSMLLLSITMLSRANSRSSSYFRKDTVAYYQALGALKRMVALLRPEGALVEGKKETKQVIQKNYTGKWSVDPNDWTVKRLKDISEEPSEDTREITYHDNYIICDVSAEDARLPLNRITKTMLSKLPGITPVMAEKIVTQRESLEKKGGFQFKEELLAINGMQGIVYDGTPEVTGLKDLVTTFTDGLIPVNAITQREFLSAIPGVDEQVAKEILSLLKAGKFFQRIEDLQHVLGVTPPIYASLRRWLKIDPTIYRIRAHAVVDGVSRDVLGIVYVGEDDAWIIFLQGG